MNPDTLFPTVDYDIQSFIDTTTTTNMSSPLRTTGSVSFEEYKQYSYIFSWIKVFGHPFTAVCLILSARVFLLPHLCNSSTVLLVSLNLAEAMHSIILTTYQMCKLSGHCVQYRGYRVFTLYTSLYLGTVLRRSVYLLNCVVSVQRYAITAFPFRSRKWRVLHSPKIISGAIFVSMVLIHSYIPLKYEVKQKGSIYIITKSDFNVHEREMFRQFTLINIYITSYIPLLIGILANIGMAHSLYVSSIGMQRLQAFSIDHKLSTVTQLHSQTSNIILVTSALFIVFALPSTLNYIIGEAATTYGPNKPERYLYHTLNEGFVLCQIVSDLVIFLSYLMLGTNFRTEFIQLTATVPCPLASVARVRSDVEKAKSAYLLDEDMRQKMEEFAVNRTLPSFCSSWKDPRVSTWKCESEAQTAVNDGSKKSKVTFTVVDSFRDSTSVD